MSVCFSQTAKSLPTYKLPYNKDLSFSENHI